MVERPDRTSRISVRLVAVEIVVIAALALAGIGWGYAPPDCGEVCRTATPFLTFVVICSIAAGAALWWASASARNPEKAAAIIGVGLAATAIAAGVLLYASLETSGWLSRVGNAVEDLFT